MKKDLLYTLWDGTKIFVVNGNEVRDTYDEDFLEGGHTLAGYNFIPKDEIWITSDVIGNDEDELLAHEIFEWYQMKYEDKGYDESHSMAEIFEEALRSVDNAAKEYKTKSKGASMNIIKKFSFYGIKSIDELLEKYALERCPACGGTEISNDIENTKGLCHNCMLAQKRSKGSPQPKQQARSQGYQGYTAPPAGEFS